MWAITLLPLLVVTSCGGGEEDKEIIDEDPIEETGSVSISNFSLSIVENPAAGAELGTVGATATSGTLTLTLTDQQPAGALAIDDAGKLTVADSSLFDFETRTSVTAVVEATNGSKSASGTVSISITDFVAPHYGLIASYSFDEGNADDEVGSNDGTVTNVTLTTDRFGNENKAYAFAGDGYIDLGANAVFEITGDYSIAFWLKPGGEAQHAPVLLKRDAGVDNFIQYNFSFFDNPYSGGASKYLKLFMRAPDGGDLTLSSQNELPASWHHIALVHTSEGLNEMYVDGALQGSATVVGTYEIAGRPLRIGGNPDTSTYMVGDIDNVFFFDRAILGEEIRVLSKE